MSIKYTHKNGINITLKTARTLTENPSVCKCAREKLNSPDMVKSSNI